MTAAELARWLSGPVGLAGQSYEAACPVCRRSTLRFRDGGHGLRLRCIAGCDVEAIAAAVGVKLVRKAWATACRKAGCPGMLPPDGRAEHGE
jgi:hypothetical protein